MFSVDWFSNNIPVWNRYLKRYKGAEVRALEVGSYEGKSATWLMEHVLTNPRSKMTCVDNFSQKHKATHWDVEEVFHKNMAPYKGRYKLLKADSAIALKNSEVIKHQYDIVYVDADHHSRHVLEDAVLCFALLKPGGIMIFDDNTDNKEHDNRCPKPAISAFLSAYANDLKVLHNRWQVVIMKRDKPLKMKGPCYSEFFQEPR